jgi:hypothetical protein
MSKVEVADNVVGNGSVIIGAGAYKGEDEKTRYKFAIRCEIPSKADMGEELADKIYKIGLARIMSVKAAGTFNKANDFGTEEDAIAFAEQFSTPAGWTEALEKVRREGGAVKVDSTETLAIRKLAAILRAKNADGNVPADFPRAADPPLTEKGIVNYNAWAKVAKAEGHKWYATALKLVSSDKGFD